MKKNSDKKNKKKSMRLEANDQENAAINGEEVAEVPINRELEAEGPENGEREALDEGMEGVEVAAVPAPELLDYEEVYLNKIYAETGNGDRQVYAKKRTRDEYYVKNDRDAEEIYAKKKKGNVRVDYYAQSAGKVEFLASLKNNDDEWEKKGYLVDENGDETYPYDHALEKEIFEIDGQGNPIFARDRAQKEFYPAYKDRDTQHKIQYVPIKADGEKVILVDDDLNQEYPINLNTLQRVYPRDAQENEYYLKDGNDREYYIERDDEEIYATEKLVDSAGVVKRVPIFAKVNDIPFYARNVREKREIYPKTPDGDEFYRKVGNDETAALTNTDDLESKYYAKDKDLNEIYPKKYFVMVNQ